MRVGEHTQNKSLFECLNIVPDVLVNGRRKPAEGAEVPQQLADRAPGMPHNRTAHFRSHTCLLSRVTFWPPSFSTYIFAEYRRKARASPVPLFPNRGGAETLHSLARHFLLDPIHRDTVNPR